MQGRANGSGSCLWVLDEGLRPARLARATRPPSRAAPASPIGTSTPGDARASGPVGARPGAHAPATAAVSAPHAHDEEAGLGSEGGGRLGLEGGRGAAALVDADPA